MGHSIRVTAHGEFGQLERGLKSIKTEFADVTNVINKGARRGGMFTDQDLRSLDLYRERYQKSMRDMTKEIERQQRVIDEKNKMATKADEITRYHLQNELKERAKVLAQHKEELRLLSDLANKRNSEADNFGRPTPSNDHGSNNSGGGIGGKGASSLLSTMAGVGKAMLAIAGIASILGVVTEAYEKAKARHLGGLDLNQRYGRGSATGMWDSMSATGRRSGMGYLAEESINLHEAYSQKGGRLGLDDQYAIQRFSRGYGLDASTVGGTMAQAKALGGFEGNSPKGFADSIAESVGKSGMTPRILEVMETSVGLLQTINTTLRDGSANQIIAYQTALDKIGNEKGMQKLTGQSGASLIGGIHGAFDDDNPMAKARGMQALQMYNPSKYGSMSYFQLNRAYGAGLGNQDNLPAMLQMFDKISGGNKDYKSLQVQNWIKSGGHKLSAEQAKQLVDEGVLDKMAVAGLTGDTDSGGAYGSRAGQSGQAMLDREAQKEKVMEQIGEPILHIVNDIKSGFLTISDKLIEGANKITEWYDALSGKIAPWLKLLVGDPNEKKDGTGEPMLNETGGMIGGSVVLAGVGGVTYKIWKAWNDAKVAIAEESNSMLSEGGKLAKKYGKRGRGFRANAGMSLYPEDMGIAPMAKHEGQGSGVIGGATFSELIDSAEQGRVEVTGLNEEQLAKVNELKEQGLLSFTELETTGSLKITKLSEEGTRELSLLTSTGSAKMTIMEEKTSNTLDKVLDEHKGLREKLSDGWDNFIQYVKSKAPTGNGGNYNNLPTGSEGATWRRETGGVNTGGLSTNAKQAIDLLSVYVKKVTGENMVVSSGLRSWGGHVSGNKFDVVDSSSSTTLERNNDGARDKIIEYAKALHLKVIDEYANPSDNATAGHLDFDASYFDTSDMTQNNGSASDASDGRGRATLPMKATIDVNVMGNLLEIFQNGSVQGYIKDLIKMWFPILGT